MASNILVPVDFSDVTETVLARAADLVRAFGAKMWLIHIAEPEGAFVGYEFGLVPSRDAVAMELHREHQLLQKYQDALRADGLNVTAMLLSGPAADKILEEARRVEADLIVLGSHGHQALHHLLAGSVCQAVLHETSCPVVLVPSKVAAAKGKQPRPEAK